MHRLLKAAKIQRSNVYSSAHFGPCSLRNPRNFISDSLSPLIINLPYRSFTTKELRAGVGQATQKKRKPRTKKEYTELVEVNDDKTNLTKAVVKKLSANSVSRLSEESNLSLEQIYKLQSQKNTKSAAIETASDDLLQNECETMNGEQLAMLEEIRGKNDVLGSVALSSMNEGPLQNQYERESEWDLIQPENVKNNNILFSLERKSELEETKEIVDDDDVDTVIKKRKKRSKQYERFRLRENTSEPVAVTELFAGRTEIPRESQKNVRLNEGLNSYIEMCVQCGLLNLAFGTINRYTRLHMLRVKKTTITGPQPFDILMHGFASKANIDKIEVLLTSMSNCRLKRTPQTYAACFECFARLPSSPENENKLKKIYKEFEASGYVFDDLMNKCRYQRDQREQVLKTIRTFDPSYVWKYPTPPRDYSMPILNHLNADRTPYQSLFGQLFTPQEMKQWTKEQANIEMKFTAKIKSAVKPITVSTKTEFFRNEWDKLTSTWREKLRDGFVKNLGLLETQLISTKCCYQVNIFPYLRVLPPEQYVEIMLDEIHRLLLGSLTYSGTIMSLQLTLGRQVKLRYDTRYREQSGCINKINKIYKDYCEWYLHPETNRTSCNPRHQWQTLVDETAATGPTLEDLSRNWPTFILLDLGKFLYSNIIELVEVDVNCLKKNARPNVQRAFYSLYRYQSLHLFEEIRPNSFLHRLYRETQPDTISFSVDLLPMLSPPRPWSTIKSGGYLYTKSEFIRTVYNSTPSPRNPNMSRCNQQLYGVFDSLNQLASVPWKINTSILDIVLKVFRGGGSLELKIPLSSAKFAKLEKKNNPNQLSFQESYRSNQRKREMYSLWVECLYRLSLADHFRDRVFWLPHNMDFRGRVYPIPPHLSHIGSDAARSLLIFAKGEKLGPRGLDWLKIHCVNLTGLKKRDSLHERLRYAEEILPEILDSAEKPLTGNMWWAKSEDIWQTLACCIEIKAALDSGDPENYVCHFPVHQDGSCNGLQHYAALGRDIDGGRSVNLMPCDRPQDVYSCVVEKVEERRAIDAQNGREIAQALEGFIKRKVIKQTVMTTVYGVTHFGARMQIAKQLKATPNIPSHVIWPGSSYLVAATFNALRSMFTSTRQIQDWFVECAKYVTKNRREFVQWETPLGLLAMQPYAKSTCNREMPHSHSKGHILAPHSTKQRNAFPPNYIHSLDSSHMMLTSLQMERKGVTFVSVHDCFWTHPNQVEIMNKVCREEFVRLHSLPLLEDLSEYLVANFQPKGNRLKCEDDGHEVLKQIPSKGSLVLEDVLRSTYFFS